MHLIYTPERTKQRYLLGFKYNTYISLSITLVPSAFHPNSSCFCTVCARQYSINKKCHGVDDNTEVRYKRLKSAIKKVQKAQNSTHLSTVCWKRKRRDSRKSLTVHGQGCERLVRFLLSKRAAKRWILYVDGFFIQMDITLQRECVRELDHVVDFGHVQKEV